MIIVTGAGGFIGSNLVEYLKLNGEDQIVVVDDFNQSQKREILNKNKSLIYVNRNDVFNFIKHYRIRIKIIYHLGARTDTTEKDVNIFNNLNLNYSKEIWNLCTEYEIPLIYASSAATYGNGEFGYDDEQPINNLKPLNLYGDSKQQFDLWVLKNDKSPPFWIGLKFFNVYGFGEYNKGRMASVVFHTINQIKETNKMNLFKSHNVNIKDGYQSRDFIFIDDVIRVLYEFKLKGDSNSGIYNLGTGKARTFLDLVRNVFSTMNIKEYISFIDTPIDIRDKYQYFTEATIKKLNNVGINTNFLDLEEAIKRYYNEIK